MILVYAALSVCDHLNIITVFRRERKAWITIQERKQARCYSYRQASCCLERKGRYDRRGLFYLRGCRSMQLKANINRPE